MSSIIKKILPKSAKNDFKGYKIAEIIFFIITIITIIRSLIHIFSPDGGARSIATIDLSVEGADVIIGLFALWGISQILLGLIFLVVFIRYKTLIPMMYLFIIIEYSMRIIVGLYKPFQTIGIAPGSIGNYIIVPLALIMFTLSVLSPKKTE
jgi:hypothetical protein